MVPHGHAIRPESGFCEISRACRTCACLALLFSRTRDACSVTKLQYGRSYVHEDFAAGSTSSITCWLLQIRNHHVQAIPSFLLVIACKRFGLVLIPLVSAGRCAITHGAGQGPTCAESIGFSADARAKVLGLRIIVRCDPKSQS